MKHALLLVLPLICLAACTATHPSIQPPPPQAEPVPPEPDPLYEQTEDELRLAFTDGLFGLYRGEVDVEEAQRVDQAEIDRWLTDLATTSPEAIAFARQQLGPVLDEAYLVGFVLQGAAVAECARIRDVLYISVPERHQGTERPFTGYIVQDTCDIPSGELGLFCTGGFGTTEEGTACSCSCTTGEAPGVGCVTCGGE